MINSELQDVFPPDVVEDCWSLLRRADRMGITTSQTGNHTAPRKAECGPHRGHPAASRKSAWATF